MMLLTFVFLVPALPLYSSMAVLYHLIIGEGDIALQNQYAETLQKGIVSKGFVIWLRFVFTNRMFIFKDKTGQYPPPQGGPAPFPVQQTAGAPPYPPGQPLAVAPYPPEQPGGAPGYPTAPPGGVAPYPAVAPGGTTPYPSAAPGGYAPYPTAPPWNETYPTKQ